MANILNSSEGMTPANALSAPARGFADQNLALIIRGAYYRPLLAQEMARGRRRPA